MPDQTIRLKSPKLGCIPIRPFLIFISSLGLFGTLSLLVTEPPSTMNVILGASSFVFNSYLFYGALHYNYASLGYAQNFVVFSMILSFAMLCFLPVLVTSCIASDYHKYLKAEISTSTLKISEDGEETTKKPQIDIFDERSFSEIARKIPEEDDKNAAVVKFLTGFVAGEMIVFMVVFSFLYSYMLYVMIKRLRKFIAARKEIYEMEMLA
ncbi:hypothetical protein L5515_009273 [Caenorhabditis briggsae]|uniref:Uncharacterized protein n=1 Tax=Caenorhabditis briggsae TaxID=6238 RepID=A0AAE9F348_CAEBR|nr:hypothetical protein L5515_009273 [Caenorhabditis briggsae]